MYKLCYRFSYNVHSVLRFKSQFNTRGIIQSNKYMSSCRPKCKFRQAGSYLFRQADSYLFWQADSYLFRQADSYLFRQADSYLFRQTDSYLFRQTDSYLFRQADSYLFRQADSYLFRQTDNYLFRYSILCHPTLTVFFFLFVRWIKCKYKQGVVEEFVYQ